jgi:ribosomal protein S18 acetylase RimI-like enzyme
MPNPAESSVIIRPMVAADLAPVHALWADTQNIELAEGDGLQELALYLKRNPGLSQVACAGDRILGAVLAGHDGRRGLLYHLAVLPERQGTGIGSGLVENCLKALRDEGILRALILVDRENHAGNRFWEAVGWESLPFAVPMGKNL